MGPTPEAPPSATPAAVHMPASLEGYHNEAFDQSSARVRKGNGYRDCSTVIVVPTRGKIDARVVVSWMQMWPLMNQKLMRLPPAIVGRGMEVGDAYNQMVGQVIGNEVLNQYRFLLTLEEDNLPPPDGLHLLIETISEGPWAAVGGLYWTKGEGGQPMVYGDPKRLPVDFMPQVPEKDTVQACRGLGMGFTLFDLNLFKDPDLPYPWFRTKNSTDGHRTQDLYFFENACRRGYRFACDTRVKVGHLDTETGIVW